MDDSGINLAYNQFDLAEYINGDIDFEQYFQQSEDILFSHSSEQPFYEIKSKTVDSSSPPTFKTATPSTRTHSKQLLMKEKTLLDSKREQQQKLKEEQQKQEQERAEQQRLEAERKQQKIPFPKVPQNVGVHFDVPSQVFKVKTVLENPTQYHVVQKQKMQIRQFLLDEMHGRRPMSQASSMPPAQPPAPPVGPQTTSLPPPSNLTTAPSPSPDVAMSPGLSSVATSASEAEDLLDELNFGSLSSENVKTAQSLNLPSDIDGNSEMFLEHLIALGSAGSTSSHGKTSLSCPSDLTQIKPEHLYSEADLQAVKDRQKKDNHNEIERRRRFNINDRIKELGTLLPKNNDPHFEIVRDVRQNKGTILKMSVAYIKTLQNDLQKSLKVGEELATQNRALIIKVKQLEQLLAKVNCQDPSELSWPSHTPVSVLNNYAKPAPMLNPSLTSVESASIGESSPLSLSDDLMDDDHPVTGDPMLSSPHHLPPSPSPPPDTSHLAHLDDMDIGL